MYCLVVIMALIKPFILIFIFTLALWKDSDAENWGKNIGIVIGL